jgi:hypothetical protein
LNNVYQKRQACSADRGKLEAGQAVCLLFGLQKDEMLGYAGKEK